MRRVSLLVLLGACSVPGGGLDGPDSAADGSTDAPLDAGVDASRDDGGEDAGVDAADAGSDVPTDVFDAGMDAGSCTEIVPRVHWEFSSTMPRNDLAAPSPRMDLEWQPLEGDFVDGSAVFEGTRLVADAASSREIGELLVAANQLTIVGWIAADNAETGASALEPRRIFGCSENARSRAFTIGQTDGELVVRMRSSNSSDENGDNVTASFFPAAAPRHFAFTWDGRRARIYVDGSEAAVYDHGGGADIVWDPAYVCLWGDELSGARAWAGSASSLRIFDTLLDDDAIECFSMAAP